MKLKHMASSLQLNCEKMGHFFLFHIQYKEIFEGSGAKYEERVIDNEKTRV
jgi:hypothetical protein